jgi:hypothetical protein
VFHFRPPPTFPASTPTATCPSLWRRVSATWVIPPAAPSSTPPGRMSTTTARTGSRKSTATTTASSDLKSLTKISTRPKCCCLQEEIKLAIKLYYIFWGVHYYRVQLNSKYCLYCLHIIQCGGSIITLFMLLPLLE